MVLKENADVDAPEQGLALSCVGKEGTTIKIHAGVTNYQL